MKKLNLLLYALALILILSTTAPQKPQACFDKTCVTLEVAITPAQRQHGLMFRTSLPEDVGMLFVFEEESKHSFWMKNTLISLDMVWISQNLTVVEIQTAIPCTSNPCQAYTPSGKALYVLEVNAGFAKKNNISKDKSVFFHNL